MDDARPTPADSAQILDAAERRHAVKRVVLVYATFATAWILFSDRLTSLLFRDIEALMLAGLIKGLIFVAATSTLLYWLMRRQLGAAECAPSAPARRPLLTLAVLALGITLFTGLAIDQILRQHKATESARLQTISDLKTRQIADWLKERLGDAAYLGGSAFFAGQYEHAWLTRRDAASLERMGARLDEYRRDNDFTAIMLLDPEGVRLWGSRLAPHRANTTLAAAARQAARDRRVRVAGPYRDEGGHLHLDILAPLARVSGAAPVVALHIDPSVWLYPTLATWPVPSASGETLLFRRDGEQILFLNELRHWTDTAARLRLPVSGARLLSAQALRGEGKAGELLEGVDYRGVPVMGVARPVPGVDWFLVAKMDRAEILATAHQEALWVGLVGLLVLFAAAGSVNLARQRQALAVARQAGQAQAERLRALRLLAAIADSSEDAIVAKDLEGRFLLFNRSAERLTGKRAQDVLGKDDYFLFPPEEARQMREIGDRIVAADRILIEEGTFTTTHGARIFLSTMGPLHDDAGKIIGVYGISRDITEHRRAEAELLDQMKRFRLLLDNSRDGIVIIDQDHRVVEANQRFADMLGYAPEELPSLHTWDFDAIYDEGQIRVGFSDLSQANRVFETRHRRKDGGEYDVEVSASGAQWSGQNLVLCVCRDIGERKRAEVQLQLWAMAFEHANFGLAIADARDNTFVAVNPSFARERGYRPEELIGRPFLTVYPPELHERIKTRVADLDRTGHGMYETEHMARDGRRFPVLMDITAIWDKEGKPIRRVAYALDISSRKRAEADLAKKTEEMQRRNEELERFNRVTIGRELDMIELKKQVNALSHALGREPPHPLAFLGNDPGKDQV